MNVPFGSHISKMAMMISLVVIGAVATQVDGLVIFLGQKHAEKNHLAITSSYLTKEQQKQSNAYAKYLMGLLHEYRGHHEEAATYFAESKQYDPDSALTRIHLGVNLAQIGKKEEASV